VSCVPIAMPPSSFLMEELCTVPEGSNQGNGGNVWPAFVREPRQEACVRVNLQCRVARMVALHGGVRHQLARAGHAS
jgi:hypothetical protein